MRIPLSPLDIIVNGGVLIFHLSNFEDNIQEEYINKISLILISLSSITK